MRFVCILYSIRMYFICHRMYFICHPNVFYMPSACIIYTIRMYFICHPYVFYMPSACVSTFICHPYTFHMPSLSIIYAILVYYAKLPSFRILSDYQREEGSDPINQLKIRLIFVLLLIMNWLIVAQCLYYRWLGICSHVRNIFCLFNFASNNYRILANSMNHTTNAFYDTGTAYYFGPDIS